MRSPYVFHLIREGREALLKSEIADFFPDFRFSFSKPGFLAFKCSRELGLEDLKPNLFSRRQGLQMGKWILGKEAQCEAKLAPVFQELTTPSGVIDVHALDYREEKGEEAPVSDHALARDVVVDQPIWNSFLKVLSNGNRSVRWNEPIRPGSIVLVAVQVSDQEIWVGVSKTLEGEFPGVGGESGITQPEEAPSRAYLKLEEAIALSNIQLKTGDTAVEVGSSPGGACYALLERGLKVIGVDRAIMATHISKHPNFERVGNSIGEMIIPTDFRAQWFLMDMNAEPEIALRECSGMIARVKEGLLGAFLTLKLNREDSVSDVPKMAARAARMLGLEKSWLKQLPSNNREVALFGVTANYLRSRGLS